MEIQDYHPDFWLTGMCSFCFPELLHAKSPEYLSMFPLEECSYFLGVINKLKFPIQDNHCLVATFSTCATLYVKTPDLPETFIVTLQKEKKIRKFYPTNILIQNMAVTYNKH